MVSPTRVHQRDDSQRNPARHVPDSGVVDMKLTNAIATEIKRAYFAREMKQQQLAEKYDTTQSTISKILSEQIWTKQHAVQR